MVLEAVQIYTVQNRVASHLKKACYHSYFINIFCSVSLLFVIYLLKNNQVDFPVRCPESGVY